MASRPSLLRRALIDPDGTPRYTPKSRYPIDGQCVAQAIQTLSLAAGSEQTIAQLRWSVLTFAIEQLSRGDGTVAFQRERLWVNRTPHPRWVQAPMLAALTHLIATTHETETRDIITVRAPVAV